jgi:hypothetical protein
MSSLLVFYRVYRLEIQSVMLVFFILLCELLPLLTFSLVYLPHLSPLPKVKVLYSIYRQCVARREWGGGVELCWRPYSGECLTLCF